MLDQPFYDPQRSYEENFAEGPFGSFANDISIERTGEPEHTFLGHQVYLPFGIPAGPLINSSFVKAAFSKGFDIAVYKTVRTREYPCHQLPNVLAVKLAGNLTIERAEQPIIADDEYLEPLSITNSFGVPSMDPDWWQQDMAEAVAAAGEGQVLVGSFQGTKQRGGSVQEFIDDYALAARLVKEAGAPILAANLSCPNEGTADLLCFDIERTQQIAAAIKEEIGNTPLLLKLAYFKNQQQLVEMVNRVGPLVDGFIAINTIPAPIVNDDGTQALPGPGRERSGVCGAGIQWAGLEMVERLVRLREDSKQDYVIVGVGGVTQPSDYTRYRNQGADAVLSATGAMWHQDLAKQIGRLLRRKAS